MSEIAARKLHVAPLRRQARAIDRLVREGRFLNVTALVRTALDHYLDHIGRPTLSEQARQMAEDYDRGHGRELGKEADRLQRGSMRSDERW